MCTYLKKPSLILLVVLASIAPYPAVYAMRERSPEHKVADAAEHARKQTTNSLYRLWLQTKFFIHWLDQMPKNHPLLGNTLTVALGVVAAGAVEASIVTIAAILGYKRAKTSGKENIVRYKKNLRTRLLEILKHIPKGTELYIKIEELLDPQDED